LEQHRETTLIFQKDKTKKSRFNEAGFFLN